MGQEQSTEQVDENTPPQTLESRSVEGVARLIREGRARRIVVMTGAGISTSAGIPDFRSPDTGLYANLSRLDLPYAEAVFELSYFRKNPLPFYTLAQELYPGKYRPTITHSFIRLLYEKGLLLKLFTQNIDCLEREAGVPEEYIVEAHGSFARQSCIDCKTPYPSALMKTAIAEKTVPVCQSCTGLVKPDIVFFGEQLPSAFFDNSLLVEDADLAIIMGTSLTVHPFASLPSMVAEHVPRVLVNQERVGGLGSRRDDVLLLEQCDDGVRRLARALGWEEELEELWGKTAPEGGALPGEKEVQKTEDERLQDEIDLITKEVEENLRLSKAQKEWVEKHVGDTPKASDSQAQPDGKENERGEAKGRSAASAAAAAAGIPESETVLHEPRQDEKKRQSQEGSGLAHVFPFLNKL